MYAKDQEQILLQVGLGFGLPGLIEVGVERVNCWFVVTMLPVYWLMSSQKGVWVCHLGKDTVPERCWKIPIDKRCIMGGMERPTWLAHQPPAVVKPLGLADAALRLRPKKGEAFKWPLRKAPGNPGAVAMIRQLPKRPALIKPSWHSQCLKSSQNTFVVAVHTAKTAHMPCFCNG